MRKRMTNKEKIEKNRKLINDLPFIRSAVNLLQNYLNQEEELEKLTKNDIIERFRLFLENSEEALLKKQYLLSKIVQLIKKDVYNEPKK